MGRGWSRCMLIIVFNNAAVWIDFEHFIIVVDGGELRQHPGGHRVASRIKFTGTLQAITELEMRLALLLMVRFNVLMLRVSAHKLPKHHALCTTDDCAHIFKVSVDRTEAIVIVLQWHLTVVLPTARVSDANTVSHDNRAFMVDLWTLVSIDTLR